jgi:enoyl-CoA hydratase/carnithine racemase
MNENILLAEEKDGVMVLSLNRPQVMNSLNFPLLHALREQVESVRFKTHTRVIIITGAGEKAFCAGADLKERATLTPDQVKEYIFTIRNRYPLGACH